MELELGAIVPGKVTGITKFGAFVTLEGGKSGLVHISEIANSYVAEVSDKLTVGQEVSVKIIGLEAGKINLSVKQALPPEPARTYTPRPPRDSASQQSSAPRSYTPRADAAPVPEDFEGRLQKFMKDSDSKMSGIRQFNDRKGGRRRK
jgi:S1 RNA binding domain protein